jgi:tetratricopeptide (TPR) repeat protein
MSYFQQGDGFDDFRMNIFQNISNHYNGGAGTSEENCIPNPSWPLKFEKLDGTEEDLKAIPTLDIEMRKASLYSVDISSEAESLDASMFKDSEMYEATLLALKAHAIDSAEVAVAEAKKALELSPVCPEAYIVLALHDANTYEEALEYFKKAMEQGLHIKTGTDVKKILKGSNLWKKTEMRAYFRGIFGVGNTLRKMGKCKEALPYYEQLIKLKLQYKPTSLTYLNYNAHLPQLWFEAFGPEECLKKMKDYIYDDDIMSEPGCAAHWFSTMALAVFASGKYTEYKGQHCPHKNCSTRNGLDHSVKMQAYLDGDCWTNFLEWVCPFVADFCLGKVPMPKIDPMPRIVHKQTHSVVQAAIYVQDCGHMWRNTPGALEFLLKMRNTAKLFKEFSHAMQQLKEINWIGGSIERMDSNLLGMTKKILDEGCFVNAVGNYHGYSTLLGIVYNQKNFVLELLRRGANPSLEGNGRAPTALQQACYYAVGPEVVTAMIEAGGDAYTRFSNNYSAIVMAIGQGNWRELDAILSVVPFGNDRKFTDPEPDDGFIVPDSNLPGKEYVYDTMFKSSCMGCKNIAGGAKCGRCRGCKTPHSIHCDYRKVVDVLFNHGVKPTAAIIKQCQRYARTSKNTGVDVHKPLAKYILWKVAKDQAAATAIESGEVVEEEEEVQWCSHPACFKTSEEVNLKLCSACKAVRYCSDLCQKSHWKALHKRGCEEFKEMRMPQAVEVEVIE